MYLKVTVQSQCHCSAATHNDLSISKQIKISLEDQGLNMESNKPWTIDKHINGCVDKL